MVVALAALLLASSCGNGTEDSTVTTAGVLGAALAETAEATTYRVSLSAAQTLKLPVAGIDTATEINEQEPLMVGEVSEDHQHFVMNLGPLLEPMLGEDLDIVIEMWVKDERLILDTQDYQQLKDQNPGAQFGPFEPGIFYVDLTDIETNNPEILAAIVGYAAPDLVELAQKLPAALIRVEQTSSDPVTFGGAITYADLLKAQGGNVETLSRSAAAGIALNSPMSVDALTELYVGFYESTEVDVVIELEDRGLLHILSTRADLSGIYSAVLLNEDLLPEMTSSERQEALEGVEGAVHILETLSTYEVDDDLEVPLPPIATEDRTQQWSEYLIGAGFEI